MKIALAAGAATAFVFNACTARSRSMPVTRWDNPEDGDRILSIHGVFLDRESLEADVDARSSPAPIEGCRGEIYVKALPSEEFETIVFRIVAAGDSRYRVELQLVRPDSRLYRNMTFEGFIFNADPAGALA
jgi:hypothetical protein